MFKKTGIGKSSTSGPSGRKSRFDLTIALPEKAPEGPKSICDVSHYWYGEKGIGKSTLAATFPDVVAHFLWEPGRVSLPAKTIPDFTRREAPLDWNRFQQYLKLIAEQDEPGRIVVDTLDLCAKAWERHWAAIKGVPSLQGIQDHGRTWSMCQDDWWNTFNGLITLGWRFTFLSHARRRARSVRGLSREQTAELVKKTKDAAVDEEEQVLSNETQPSASPWAVGWSKIPVELMGYMGWIGKRRVLQIRGSGDIAASAGSRGHEHFLQKKGAKRAGEPYYGIPLGENAQEAYVNLNLAWENKLEGLFEECTGKSH